MRNSASALSRPLHCQFLGTATCDALCTAWLAREHCACSNDPTGTPATYTPRPAQGRLGQWAGQVHVHQVREARAAPHPAEGMAGRRRRTRFRTAPALPYTHGAGCAAGPAHVAAQHRPYPKPILMVPAKHPSAPCAAQRRPPGRPPPRRCCPCRRPAAVRPRARPPRAARPAQRSRAHARPWQEAHGCTLHTRCKASRQRFDSEAEPGAPCLPSDGCAQARATSGAPRLLPALTQAPECQALQSYP